VPARNRARQRYVTLREGGSLPAIVEADDDGMRAEVRGAGQDQGGLVSGEIARARAAGAGSRVAELDPDSADRAGQKSTLSGPAPA
jgi:hypothetical protein